MKQYDISILGFGISSFCFLLYLYNNNLLHKHKILIFEKNNSPCLNSLKYKNINSNSTLRSLIEPFRIEIFKDIILKFEEQHDLDKFVNLKSYNEFIVCISKYFLNHLQRMKNITIKFNHKLHNIDYSSRQIKIGEYSTKTCIISMGAKQDINNIIKQDSKNILKNKINKCILPNEIYNSQNLSKFEGKKIAVIGSSHSSLSIVDALLSRKVNFKKISLLCRNDFKVYFESCELALKKGFSFNQGDVCTETQTVNRFDGLRENSKRIYMNLKKYGVNKICDKKISCDDYDVIVPCWGYYKTIPKINNINYEDGIDSNESFELLINKNKFTNIFLLGLNSNPKVKITQKSFKRSIDGVWLYYNLISPALYKSILQKIINEN
jgi:hypothetical protein